MTYEYAGPLCRTWEHGVCRHLSCNRIINTRIIALARSRGHLLPPDEPPPADLWLDVAEDIRIGGDRP